MPKIALPNGCSCSLLTVFPKNWKTKSASLKKDWYISYRFYDPNFPKPKQRIIKGMNEYKTVHERQAATKFLMEDEMNMLKNKAFNPFTKTYIKLDNYEIDPSTPFVDALRAVFKKLNVAKTTKRDLRNVIDNVEKSAGRLRLSDLSISEISRKYIKLILNDCGTSAHKFNKYRTYLIVLFNELIDLEAIENDPVSKIKKRKVMVRKRKVLTLEERKAIDKHLHDSHYTFWRFMHIFFHSGSRETEMLQMKFEDVDLFNQKFTVHVKKGQKLGDQERTIKNIVLNLWQEIMSEAIPGQYLFSKFLKPGPCSIDREQISRRWRKYVKAPPPKGLNIKADFYSLKHSNLDEIAEALSVKEASMAAGHTSTKVTKVHYLMNEQERQHQRLKEVSNKFA